MTVADCLRERARSTPDRIALVCQGGAVSYRELDTRADHVACRLAGLGVGPGDRVAVLAPNGIPFAVLVYALARLQAVLVPLPARLVPAELARHLQDSDPLVLLADPRFREAVRASGWARVQWVTPDHPHLLPDVPPAPVGLADRIDLDAVQGVVYTSGSTGSPKGVLLTYGNHWWNAWGWALRLGVRDDDTWLAVLPFAHVGGLAILWRAAVFGATVVVHETFEAGAVRDALDRGGVTLVSLVSTMLRRVLDHGGDRPFGPSVRAVLLGGGPIPQDLVERCLRARIPLSPTYGLTEAASQVATLRPEEVAHHPGSCGRPLVPVEVRIAEDGEILVRGPTVMRGYWGRPAETQDALQGGWLHTGDFGYLDSEGYLHVLDRREDRITTGGENVSPQEVEAVLRLNPAVEDVGVVGVPDPEWGQVVVAVVRRRPHASTTEEALRAFCREHLAPYKVPKRILFCDALPYTGPEKLDRAQLRAWVERSGTPSACATLGPIERTGGWRMAEIVRTATATWAGDLRSGTGRASTSSGALQEAPITFPSRFEQAPGSNPEELIAAAHAACFSMALSAELTRRGSPPQEIRTKATLTLETGEAGPRITRVHLETEGRVPGVDEGTFREAAEQAKENCPVSKLLKPGLQSLTLDARLVP